MADRTGPAAPVGLRALPEAIRPRHWIKNLLVFAAAAFTGRLGDPHALALSGRAFAAFCAAASAIYLLDDVCDRAADQRHPRKRGRPVASGRLSVPLALGASGLLAAAALWASRPLGAESTWVVLGYLGLGLAYSLWLRQVPLVDALAVAAGFVLRAVAGAAALQVSASPWLSCCTFLLALFVALGKRRSELAQLGTEARLHRPALANLSLRVLDGWLSALSGATLVCYALYTQAPRTVAHLGTDRLILSLPWVVLGVLRYQWLAVEGEGGDPAAIFWRDWPLVGALAGWGVTVMMLMRG